MIEIGKKPRDGRDGLDGNDGEDGKNGVQFYTGNVEPTQEIGVNGDVYLDTESCFFYQKKYDKWLFQCNLKGKKGKDGTDGIDGTDGVTQIITQHSGGGGGGSTAPTSITQTILAGQTKTIHLVALSAFYAIDYIFNVRKSDLTKSKSFKMFVSRTDVGLEDTIFARLGSKINYSIDVQINGSNAEIIITNNEAFDLITTFKHEFLI